MSEIDILNLLSLSPLYFIHIYISTKIYLLSITKLSNRNIEHTYLHVHVEGGLAVVLLPPARAPRGSVHAARLHAPSHRDTCPAHTCRDKGTRVSSRLNNTWPDSLSTCQVTEARVLPPCHQSRAKRLNISPSWISCPLPIYPWLLPLLPWLLLPLFTLTS